MPAILLSHHRTGSTAIRQALEGRLRVYQDEPLVSYLDAASLDMPFPWRGFLLACEHWQLIHCHREHVNRLKGWQAIADYGCPIIHLSRQNHLQQCLSYRRALKDQVWHGHPRGHSHGDEITLEELTEQTATWAALEMKADYHFRDLPALWITYEEFAAEPEKTIERIVAFVLKSEDV